MGTPLQGKDGSHKVCQNRRSVSTYVIKTQMMKSNNPSVSPEKGGWGSRICPVSYKICKLIYNILATNIITIVILLSLT
jgi:hypothetical protein